jgi:spore germination protein
MDANRHVTLVQTVAILVSTIIGVGVLSMPLFGVHAADTGAPLVTLLGALLAMVGVLLVAILGRRFPDKTIIRYTEDILGRWPAFVGNAIIVVFFAQLTAFGSREFGEVVVTSVLKRTPLEVTVIVMLLMAAIASRNGMRTFAYIHLFYLPFILAPGLIIVVLSLKNAKTINLLPITGNDPSGMLPGLLLIAALFQGFFVLSIVIPHMKQPQQAVKASIWGVSIAGGFYVLIVAAAVAVFGAEEIRNLLWPTLELAKTTSLPANVLERLDAAFLAVWVTAVFTTLFASYFLTVCALAEMFRLQDHRLFSYFLLPFVTAIAMLPQNVVQMYDIIAWTGKFGLLLTIAYPGLLLLVALARGKRGDLHAG